MNNAYGNPRDSRSLKPLNGAGSSNHKIPSVVEGAPDIVFTTRNLTVEELKRTRKCKYNLRDTSMLNEASVKDISDDMKGAKSNKAPAYGYIEGGIIYIMAGNRRKELIIQKGGTLLIFVADSIREEDKAAISKSFDIYIPPGAADKATSYVQLLEESKADLAAGNISEDEVLTQNKIAKMYGIHKSTVSKLIKVEPLVKAIDKYFPVKSLIHYNFLTKLVEGNKDNLDKTVEKINNHIEDIEDFANSKKALIDENEGYSAENCTSDIENYILTILFKKEKKEVDLSEFEQFSVNRKGLSISRKPNGNLSINLKYDSQTNEVIELIKKLAKSD